MTSRNTDPGSVAYKGVAGHVSREEFRTLENRVDVHDVRLAVQDANQTTMQKTLTDVVDELKKTRWTLIGFAFAVAGSAVGAVVGVG